MVRYHNEGSVRSSALPRLATIVLAMVCIAGTAAAWTWDAASARIVAPAGNNVDSGTVVAPSAVVRNLGDSTASFPVIFSITPDYADTVQVDSLVSGDSLTLTFADWTAHQRGTTTAKCSTALVADESTANDRVSRNFNVRVRDVSADSILAPRGNVNLGVALTPQARVTNHGTGNAMFQAKLRIGTFYSESTFVGNLGAGASRTVNFASWTPDSLGAFAVACTVALNGDTFVVDNNLVLDSCTVITLEEDAGVMRVVAPTGIVDSGAVLAPQAMVRNFGTDTISFPAIFTVGSYVDTQQVTGLASLDSMLVTFADWTAEPLGMLVTRCTTALADDSNPTNDARSDSVQVIIRTTDVGAVSITAPSDTVDSGTVVPVKAWVRNFGREMQSFPVRARIGSLYSDTVQVDSLAAGDSLEVTFADYTVPVRGTQTVRCSTMLTGDQIVANNRVFKSIFRRVRDVGVTRIVGPVGSVDSGTVVPVEAMVRNHGNTAASFYAIFNLGTIIVDDTFLVSDLGPLDSLLVTYGDWTASPTGTFTTRCTTAMYGDQVPSNDAVYDSVQVIALGISGPDPLDGIPGAVTLSGSGPFAGRVAIEYGLPRSAVVRLEVYDACGRVVRVLASGPSAAGYHTAEWKCSDDHGRAIAQGAYFVRLMADGVTLTSKVVKTE